MQKKKLENYEKKILSNKKEMIETYLNKLNCLWGFLGKLNIALALYPIL